MIFSAVLTRSLAFGPEHVEWLGRQVADKYPEAKFVPFTDCEVGIPHERLQDGFPTWWAKMEALRRLTDDTVVMIDLDTVLVRPIDIPVPPDGFAYMQASPRDVTKVWGGLQISSPGFRRDVTDKFYADPQGAIEACTGCDQKYYAGLWMPRIKILNAIRPDAIVSYKMHVLKHGLTPEMAFVMFHAIPRPWQANEPWIPPLFPPKD